jgi:hypothetical protein
MTRLRAAFAMLARWYRAMPPLLEISIRIECDPDRRPETAPQAGLPAAEHHR